MNLFSYIVASDSGFAPNPFHGVCTLACCKPDIRRGASVGDLIVGLTPKRDGSRVVYVMRVTTTLNFKEYWRHPKFRKKQSAGVDDCGDNIYQPLAADEFRQHPSGHSHRDGSENPDTKERDLGGEQVLLSGDFVYFGGEAIKPPKRFVDLIVGRGHRRFRKPGDGRLIEAFEKFFDGLPRGRRGNPARWRSSRCKPKKKGCS